MAYQSIFSGGNFSAPTKASPLATGFVPGQYAKVNAGRTPALAPLDPNKLNDVKSLQTALKTKQISMPQFLARFQTVANAPTNLNPYSVKNVVSGAAQGIKQGVVQPIVNSVTGTAKQIGKQATYLAGPTATTAQRQSIINNQNKAASSPSAPVINKSKGNSAQGIIQAQKLAASGASPKQVSSALNADKAKLTAQTKTGVTNAVNIAGLYSGGDIVGAKTLGKALGVARTAAGKDAGVNALIDTQKAANAAKKARAADIVGSQTVKEAKTTRVPVVSPTETKAARTSLGNTAIANSDRTSIPVVGKSTQVAGKVNTVTDAQYTKKSAQLSKQYEADSAKLKDVPHPVTQQVLQRQLDTKYSKLQQELDASAGKTTVGFTGKATPTMPRSALDATTPEGAPKFATTGEKAAATTTTPKKVEVAGTTVAKPQTALKSLPGKGEVKASGSALRTQAKAVEQGMQNEGQVAGFKGVSHKEEAIKAVQLVHEDPQKALDIAMGRKRGDNASHESAVYHAVENQELDKAAKTGDYTTVQQLASSTHHTGVAEAAQKLGAQGYNLDPHDPIGIMNDVAKTRQKAVERRAGTTVTKEASAVEKEVKQALPKVSRQEWFSFVESLKC